MKFTLKRSLTAPVNVFEKWKVQRLTLEETELAAALKCYLTDVMEGILDPDISGKKPDKFVENLQSGRLGDYSQRYIITAKDNDRVIGLLIGLPEEEQKLHIYSMGVVTDYRNKRVASALLANCINDMFRNNIKEIILDVHSDNLPAFSLYSKFDFK